MKLDLSFPELETLVWQMGAKPIRWTSSGSAPPVDFGKRLGQKMFEIDDLETVTVGASGVLTYDGRVVIVYIKDVQCTAYTATKQPHLTKRFHVADCTTLQNMRRQNRYSRYVATNSTSGSFRVDVFTDDARSGTKEIDARLLVCKNCLLELNYMDYRMKSAKGRDSIWQNFDVGEFLQKYDTSVAVMPAHGVDDYPGSSYAPSWKQTSKDIRALRGYRCEHCGVRLSEYRPALHVHHRNGIKGDERPSNLAVLCAICHSEQPAHRHMYVDPDISEIIRLERERQNIGN